MPAILLLLLVGGGFYFSGYLKTVPPAGDNIASNNAVRQGSPDAAPRNPGSAAPLDSAGAASGLQAEIPIPLTLRANVAGAKVFLHSNRAGEKLLGTTPLPAQSLAPDWYSLRLEKDGYLHAERQLDPAQGPWKIEITLEADTASNNTWTEPLTGMEFVKIPGGCFQMGSPPSEPGRFDNEKQHRVCLDDFWLAKTEVTNAQYRLFKADHDSGEYKGNSLNGDQQPVVTVSWNEAQAFSEWLSQRSGKSIRLPSEAQWEYAARAGEPAAYYWGDDPDKACEYANVRDQSAKQFAWGSEFNCNDGQAVTAPVGSFQANAFALHDMHGNAWEWTQDWYGDYSSAEQRNPTGPDNGSSRVVRGGSWGDVARYVRAAYRARNDPDYRLGLRGFRCARVQ